MPWTPATTLIFLTGASAAAALSLAEQGAVSAIVIHGFAQGMAARAELLGDGDLQNCQCFVIDQRMPGMSGMDLIENLRERNVGTPAILVISQPSDALSGRAAKAGVPIVEKPFLSNMLVERIHEACRLDR